MEAFLGFIFIVSLLIIDCSCKWGCLSCVFGLDPYHTLRPTAFQRENLQDGNKKKKKKMNTEKSQEDTCGQEDKISALRQKLRANMLFFFVIFSPSPGTPQKRNIYSESAE